MPRYSLEAIILILVLLWLLVRLSPRLAGVSSTFCSS